MHSHRTLPSRSTFLSTLPGVSEDGPLAAETFSTGDGAIFFLLFAEAFRFFLMLIGEPSEVIDSRVRHTRSV